MSKTVPELEASLETEKRRNMLLSELIAALVKKKAECRVIWHQGKAWKLLQFPNPVNQVGKQKTIWLALLTEEGYPTCWIANILDTDFEWPDWARDQIERMRELYVSIFGIGGRTTRE